MKQFKFFSNNNHSRLTRTIEHIPTGFIPIRFAENDIISEGWNAHRTNMPPGQCPYGIGTRERELWMRGWAAREDRHAVPAPIRDIAVICVSLNDFRQWKRFAFTNVWEEGDMEHRFVRNGNRYIAIASIDSIRGRMFDGVHYTEMAYERYSEDTGFHIMIENCIRR